MVIVILIMTLLSLIVVAMTRNANREQRQALDRQLNSQAFYAAESGINDAKDYYFKNATDPATPRSKDSCDGVGTAVVGDQFPERTSDLGNNSRYSCVLYDADPPFLEYTSIDTNASEITPLEDIHSGLNIQSLTFKWKKADINQHNFSDCPGGNNFPPRLPDNCGAGMLRIELIDPSAPNRDELTARSFLAFISPGSNANPVTQTYAQGAQGLVWSGGCGGDDNECSITINGVNKRKLILHLRSIYSNNWVKITGRTNANTDVEFKNAQMMVDSTGRSADVLKRIRAMVPLHEFNGVYPEFALQTKDDICKLQQIFPPGAYPPSRDDC